MQLWRAVSGLIAAMALASSLAAQTPVLGSIVAPYPAMQNAQPIHLAGNSYNAGQVAYGPVGTPLVLPGSSFGDEGEVWFVSYYNSGSLQSPNEVIAGAVQAAVTLWTPTAITLSVPPGAMSGLVKVVTSGKSSNGLPFMVMPGVYSGSCPAVPAQAQLQIQTASLQDGSVGSAYSATLSATGGSNSYAWAILSGSLPPPLTLSSSGTISGTPTAASGPVSFTVQVTDTSSQQHDVATLSLQIDGLPDAGSSTALYSYCIGATNSSNPSCSTASQGYDGVGNVLGYSDSVNGVWSFNYDSLNRISGGGSTAKSINGITGLCYNYDSFGNRTSSYDQACSAVQTNGSIPQNAYYNASNQLNSGLQSYDGAGNLTGDASTGNSYLYDGEGRICAVQQSPVAGINTMTQYLYDADGTRVAKGTISSFSCDNSINTSTGLPNNGFTATTAYILGPHNEQMTEMTNQSCPSGQHHG